MRILRVDSRTTPQTCCALLLCLLSIAAITYAQETVAPTPDTVAPVRGDNWHGYNFVNSIETGYRFADISGDNANYRSAVNYGNGIRLLSGSLSINSRSGTGQFFDNLFLTTEGLGGDPYEASSFRVEKNRVYSYNGIWRSNQYFDPGLVTDGGAGVHLQSTEYQSQDHNLILFPQSAIRPFVGYSRDTQDGSGISSEQLLDSTADTFPLFSRIKFTRNEYRIGSEFHWHGTVLKWTRAWANFKDDTGLTANDVSQISTAPQTGDVATAFRTQPFHGTNPYWIVALFHNTAHLNFNGQFTYTSGQGAFISSEGATVVNALAGDNRQTQTLGDGKRPVATGNVTITLFPTSKLTFTDHTSLYNVRSEGNSAFVQFDNFTQDAQLLYFQSLGVRTFATDADVSYDLFPWATVIGGYEFSTRRITSVENLTTGGTLFPEPFTQHNDLHSGRGGFRVRPWKTLVISAEGEIGRDSSPLTPKGDGDYHAVRANVSYRLKRFQAGASFHEDRNATSVSLSAYAAQTRTWSANASWSGKSWLTVDASYSKLHINTIGGIAFFADGLQFPQEVSYYVSNLHSATLGVRLSPKSRFTLFLGGSITKDTGDGRSQPTSTNIGPAIPGFQAAQTFPVQYLSPVARLSVRITERTRWNAGYQLYDYSSNFSPGLNFAARTGYTSFLWSF